jgi:hypothetical protein
LADTGNGAYLREIEIVLPRLLSLCDRDSASPTFGLSDRLYWSWKLIDFPNATHQGAVHGLAQLLASGLLPSHISRRSILERIDSMIGATTRIIASDGSLAEAFPRESSFCVTALVAYDILSASHLLGQHCDAETIARWKGVAAPLIAFLLRNDETHAMISNHLATGVAALMRWDGPEQDGAHRRGKQLLERILAHQSPEGWFSEYGGLDPGYETLGLTYLADVHQRNPQFGLAEPLEKSLTLLNHFAHPDGSFGGLYGSRNTRFLIPGGLEELAKTSAPARTLARFARLAIGERTVVTLSAVDEGNLAPMFNAYCRAAAAAAYASSPDEATHKLNCHDDRPWRKHLSGAGLLIDNGPAHYTIVSLNKGGVVQHYPKGKAGRAQIDAGALARRGRRLYSTQAVNPTNLVVLTEDHVTVEAPFVETKSERPTPFQFMLLRALSLTLFRYRPFLEWVKRRLVARLITGQQTAGVMNRRIIRLGTELAIEDEMIGNGLVRVDVPRPFAAIHMASAGYWQRQDDEA